MVILDTKRLRELCDAATPGPWQWFGNTKTRDVYLATIDRGRVFVMDFVRWGMTGAQPRFQVRLGEGGGVMRGVGEFGDEESPLGPKFEVSYRRQFVGIGHPDAAFIAAARTAVPDLIDEVERLRAKLDAVANGDFEAWCDKLVASRVANAQHAYDRVVAERDNARANARILAHSYTHDSRPPQHVVDEALAYPARPEPPFVDDESRCAVCGWPLALPPSTAGTCLRGNCSMRPRPERLYAPERAAKESK